MADAREVVAGQVDADTAGPPLATGTSPEAGTVITQTFRAPVDGLAALELHLANYGRTADGTVEVRLAEDGGRRLALWHLPAERVVDNAWHRFSLSAPAAGIAGDTLALGIRRLPPDPARGGRDGGPADDRPITVWTTAGDTLPEGSMAVDGVTGTGDLTFRVVYHPGWRDGGRWVLAGAGYPPATTALLVWGAFASALGVLALLARDAVT